ncbi:hypothetical protein CDEST_04215 [Colletotrichum destructivum]|uniref:Uncharacterized protein n=1 Tax=Colletotrichum destructivum TaxID=34406 RepID=A0AAX4I7J6_9PEZI|nr:hypothetical protein CDEST_04215 [Colletotrichum destructivum]
METVVAIPFAPALLGAPWQFLSYDPTTLDRLRRGMTVAAAVAQPGTRHSRLQKFPMAPIQPSHHPTLSSIDHSRPSSSLGHRPSLVRNSATPKVSHDTRAQRRRRTPIPSTDRDITSHMEGAPRRSKRDADPVCRFF